MYSKKNKLGLEWWLEPLVAHLEYLNICINDVKEAKENRLKARTPREIGKAEEIIVVNNLERIDAYKSIFNFVRRIIKAKKK